MKILVIEDETKISDFIRTGLLEDGFIPTIAPNGTFAKKLTLMEKYDAYILDLMLPDADGIELCRQFRDDGITSPILILSAKAALNDKVGALSAGADDYLTKPFEYAELLARLRALIRKNTGYTRTNISIEDLFIDPNTKTVTRNGENIVLSKKEYQLLEYLARHHDKLVTREMISKLVWDCDTNTYTNIIDVFINYLRKKIDRNADTKLIHTIRGKGFMISGTVPGTKE